MHTKRIDLSKVIKSVIMKEIYIVQNIFFRLNSNGIEYTKFHSQFGEDRYIYEHINLPEQGTFVDVGAGHPISLSNTYFFEKNGWMGVCIDADPRQCELLKMERANVEWAAISPEEGEIDLFQAYSPTYSSTLGTDGYRGLIKVPFKKTIRVPSFKLETILEKYGIGVIDLLSIDIEGTELEAWKTFDCEKHKPKVVVIEYYTFGLPDNSKKIKDFFSDLPYELVHTTCTNFIFLNRDF
jgi:FkbM family methyltransferase